MRQRTENVGLVIRALRHDATLAAVVFLLGVVCAVMLAVQKPSSAARAEAQTTRANEAAPAPASGTQLVALVPAIEGPVAPPEEPAAPVNSVYSGELAVGDSVARRLAAEGISAESIHLIDRGIRPHFDFRRAQPGHTYRLVTDPDGRVLSFRYRISMTESYVLRLEGEEYVAGREEAELTPHVARIAGVVTSSLHGAIRALGEHGQLANDFADVFAWDIDFSRSVHAGDEFSILYERLYLTEEDGEEEYVRPGRIFAAHYEGSGGSHTAVYFEEKEGFGGYYRPDGSSVEGQFLRTPVRYGRITSRYTTARRHPILKITRPHHGIDYAASLGTPVWAVGDGKIIYRGRAGGFGNLVKVRHAKGYISYYSHLSRFTKNLRVGDAVRQKQVVGYVGQTGLATGPHVCFRITKDGRYVNPARLRTPARHPVAPEEMLAFSSARDVLLAELAAGALVATDEAL